MVGFPMQSLALETNTPSLALLTGTGEVLTRGKY